MSTSTSSLASLSTPPQNQTISSSHVLPNAHIYSNMIPKDAQDKKYMQTSNAQQIDLNIRLVCSYCKDPVPNIVEDFKQGDLICGSCGTVFKDRIIDTRSEWRTFTSDEGGDDPSRVGAAENKLMGKMNLETSISNGTAGSKDLSRIHAKTSSIRHNKSLTDGYRIITNLGDKLGLARNEVDTGKALLLQICEQGFPVNKNLEQYAGAALLLGCRSVGINQSVQDLANLVNANKNEFGRLLFKLKRKIGNVNRMTTTDEGVRAAAALDLPPVAGSFITHIAHAAKDFTELASRVPGTIQGAALWFVSHLVGQPKDMDEIAKHVRVGPSTIRQAYKILYTNRNKIMNESMLKYSLNRLPVA